MTTKRYFILLGSSIALIGLLGVLGILKPVYVINNNEHWGHLGLGLLALAVVFAPGLNRAVAPYHQPALIVIGALALLIGLFGFLVLLAEMPAPNVYGMLSLNNWLDNALHLSVGGSALWVALHSPAQQRA